MKQHVVTTNIILYCRQWEKTVRFYKDLLRLPVNFSNDWFVEFNITATSRLSVANDDRTSVKSCEGNGVTLTLEVDDIDQIWEKMKHRGAMPTRIRRHPWDARVFYLHDPEGYRIEIWQRVKARMTGMLTG